MLAFAVIAFWLAGTVALAAYIWIADSRRERYLRAVYRIPPPNPAKLMDWIKVLIAFAAILLVAAAFSPADKSGEADPTDVIYHRDAD